MYHASRGRLRKYLRWADYATIDTATMVKQREKWSSGLFSMCLLWLHLKRMTSNPKTKNIRLYVKRVFISNDFDGELVITVTNLFKV